MLKNPKKITNPMTIIAIFAALSETSAAVSLPFLEEDDRKLYVWFLISFPFYLLLLFFITLNFNYRSLYAPSDFTNDENFLKNFEKSESESKGKNLSKEPCARTAFSIPSIVLCGEEAPEDSQRTHNTSDPPLEAGVDKLFIQHNIQLPKSMSNLHIIDARQMDAKTNFSTILEKTSQNEKQNARLNLFLANEISDVLLKQHLPRRRKHTKKNPETTICIIYNVSTQNVTVLE